MRCSPILASLGGGGGRFDQKHAQKVVTQAELRNLRRAHVEVLPPTDNPDTAFVVSSFTFTRSAGVGATTSSLSYFVLATPDLWAAFDNNHRAIVSFLSGNNYRISSILSGNAYKYWESVHSCSLVHNAGVYWGVSSTTRTTDFSRITGTFTIDVFYAEVAI